MEHPDQNQADDKKWHQQFCYIKENVIDVHASFLPSENRPIADFYLKGISYHG